MAICYLILLILPFAGALACALMPTPKLSRYLCLAVCLAALLVTLVTLRMHIQQRDLEYSNLQMRDSIESRFAMGDGLFALRLDADWISLTLILLTVILQPLAMLASWGSIKERETEYYAWMLVLLGAMLGVFLARDLLLFYIFFELTLVPMFFIIGIWGGPDRRKAAFKFFLFTFTGGIFTLAGVIYLGVRHNSFDMNSLLNWAGGSLSTTERFWLFMAFFAGFAVKVPLFPVHTWLPLAHTEAPTAGSVILAGVLLKLGTYGFLRVAVPFGLLDGNGNLLFPMVVQVIGILCLIGIIYGALVAWVQQDIKKLVAYSSVSHLGFCILGMMALNEIGIKGSVMYMINHGISTGALFLVIGMIYDRYHTRDINALSGLAKKMPILAFFFVLFTLSSIGLPGLNGFVSEFLTILGAFTSEHLGIGYGAIAALGIILGAIYMLHMTARVIWGPLKVPGGHDDAHGHGGHAHRDHGHESSPSNDIGAREITVLVPLAILVIVLGVAPNLVMDRMTPGIRGLLGQPPVAELPVAMNVHETALAE